MPKSSKNLSLSRQLIIFLCLLCLVLASPIGFANSFKFSILNSVNGFPQASILAITQDADGALWLGTEGGLVRYDGLSTTVFRHDINNPDSLPENMISSLLFDKQGRLWIGSMGNGLSIFDPQKNIFRSFDMAVTGDTVLSLALSENGDVFVGANNGVFHIGQSDFKIDILASSFKLSKSNNIVGLWQDTTTPNMPLWVATNHGYLFALDIEKPSITLNPDKNPIQRFTKIDHAGFTSLKFTKSHGLLVSAGKKGLFQVDRSKLLNASPQLIPLLESSIPAEAVIYDVAEADNHTLWLATSQGLIEWQRDATHVQLYRSNPNNTFSLSQNDIRNVFVSDEQVLWLGTKTKGLNYTNLKTYGFNYIEPFKPITINLNDQFRPKLKTLKISKNLDSSTVWSILKDSSGGLWVGTNSGLNYRPTDQNSFTHLNLLGTDNGIDKSVLIEEAMTLVEANGLIWIGTYGKGLIAYSPLDNKIIHHYKVDASESTYRINDNIIRLLRFDSLRNCLWVGTKYGGLNKIDFTTQTVSYFTHDINNPASLPHNSVRAIYLAPDKRLWIGTGAGLSLFNDKTQQFSSLFYSTKSDGLSDEDVRAIYQSGSNTLWVATGNGLNKVSINPLKVVLRLGEQQGLPESTLYTLVPDSFGALWISTLNGLSRFEPETLTFNNFFSHHGLQDNEFNFNAWFKDSAGELFFGGINGVNYFNPSKLTLASTLAKPLITSVNTYDNKMKKKVLKHFVSKSLSAQERLELEPNFRRISFNFSSNELISPSQVGFRYRLKNFEENWNTNTDTLEKTATYTNLKNGNYVFELETVNQTGTNNPKISLPFAIAAHYWETLWFKVLASLLVALLLWFFALLKVRHAQQQTINHERLTHYRRVVHELKTPLVHIRTQLSQLNKILISQGTTSHDQTTGLINTSQKNIKRSLVFLDQLHAIVKLNSTLIEEHVFLLEDLVDEVFLTFTKTTENQKRITINPYNKELSIKIFDGGIYLILSNLISNALKHSQPNTPIMININAVNSDLIIECISEGKPVSSDVKESLKTSTKQLINLSVKHKTSLGLGLNIIKQVADYHGGKVYLQASKMEANHFVVKLRNVVVKSEYEQ